MKNIVIDARELNTSSGRYVFKLIENLQKIDKINTYKLLLKPSDISGFKTTNKNFEAISCPYKEFTFAEQTGLHSQIKSLKPDLVHFTFPQQPALYSAPTITTIHDLTTLRFSNPDKNIAVFKTKQKIYEQLMKRVAKKSARIITPSNYVKNDLVDFSGVRKSKVIVTYEAADKIKQEAKVLPELKGRDFIMYIGRPTPHKNLERLIEAFANLQKNHPNLILVLAGKEDANYKRIKQGVTKSRIQNVFFSGFVSEAELRWLYENCKAYVFPSLSEGFGLPGLEAMVHGAPVVSSSSTSLPEIYADAAEYFNAEDVSSIEKAIDKVLKSKTLRDKLIKRGYEIASKYSWDKMAKQTLKIYKAVLNND